MVKQNFSKDKFKLIGFDADDTLWINEPYFRETENKFYDLLSEYASKDTLEKKLFKTEIENLSTYGFGVKGFVLSMIETALNVSDQKLSNNVIAAIVDLGKAIYDKPVVLLDGVVDILNKMKMKGIKMIVATKGDLLHQQSKLLKSSLGNYFHHIEIMSDKKESDYLSLLNHLEVNPQEFLMIGNSLKSDIIPVLNLGGAGIHIPFHTTWIHEEVSVPPVNANFTIIEYLHELEELLEL